MAFPFATPYLEAMKSPTTLERAFDLARSGDYASVGDIRLRLKDERFEHVEGNLAGSSIKRQLRKLCDEARARRPALTEE